MQEMWHISEYIEQGGWIMIPLVVVSVLMWGLIADRLREFARLARRDFSNTEALLAVNGGSLEAVSSGKTSGLKAMLVNDFLNERSGSPALDKEILRQCSMRLRNSLDHQLALIAVLAGVAPLLGLLGTVLGMIETFDVIAIFGTGNARALAGGISVALVTTQTGLLVAIPGLLMSNRLNRSSQQLKLTLDEVTSLIVRHVGAGKCPQPVLTTGEKESNL